MAVLGSLLVSRQLLSSDVNKQLNAELTHEASKFRAFSASDIDPQTGRRYTSVGGLLAAYLERNLPEGVMTWAVGETPPMGRRAAIRSALWVRRRGRSARLSPS